MKKETKKETKKEQELDSVVLLIRGDAVSTFEEDGKFTVKIAVSPERIEKIENAIVDLNGNLHFADVPEYYEGEYEECFSAKTSFSIPIYDTTGNQINADEEDYQIYPGADAIFKLVFKEVVYRKKKYVSAYLLGATIIKQGEKYEGNTTSFDDFKDMLKEEDVQF